MQKAKRVVLLGVILPLLFGVIVIAQHLVVEPTMHHLGLVQDGKRVARDFALTNHGSSPVTIHGVDFNCGCISYWFLLDGDAKQRVPFTVPAGQSVQLEVTFNTHRYARFSQPVSQVLTIHSSDPERASFQVTVRATVVDTLPSHQASPAAFREAHVFLVDLRSPEAFAEGHLFGAINIPFDTLEAWLPKLPQGGMFFLYDEDGSLSDQASWIMMNHGQGGWWGRAHAIQGGLAQWRVDLGSKFYVGDHEAIVEGSPERSSAMFSQTPETVAGNYIVVVDLSPAETFRHAHIPGSVNLEPQGVVGWAETVPERLGLDAVSEVVVWILDDEGGTTSCAVAETLIALGFRASCIRGGREALRQETGDDLLWATGHEADNDG